MLPVVFRLTQHRRRKRRKNRVYVQNTKHKHSFYYQSAPLDNRKNGGFRTLYNRYMIPSTNFEDNRANNHRVKNFTHSDLYVTATYIYYFAPLKRKLKRPVKDRSYTGRNIYQYDHNSNMFYVDNKFKFTEKITLRYVVFTEVEIFSKSKNQRVIFTQDANNGISIQTLVEKVLQITNGDPPANVFTNDPIISELCVFLFSFHLKKEMFNVTPSSRVEVKVLYIHKSDMEDVVKLHPESKEYTFKFRGCTLKNQDNNNNNKATISPKDNCLYNYQDEPMIIVDNNYNHLHPPKIFLNIPIDAVHEDYFNEKNDDVSNLPYFIKNDFLKPISKAIVKYFKN